MKDINEKTTDTEAAMQVLNDAIKAYALDIYSKDQLLALPDLVAETVMLFVGGSFYVKRIKTMDTMAVIESEVADRHVSIHLHPDKRISYLNSFVMPGRDPEMPDDIYHMKTLAKWLGARGYKLDLT